jgi:APA family basic amino acid/polyamine antiporter
MTTKQPELIRGLGPWAAMAIVVGTMIGTGIFIKPSEMARDTGSVALIFAAWILGGALSLFGALSYAELGAALPQAGGEYPYLKRGLDERWAFLFGWMHSVVGRPASISSIAAGLMLFLGFLIPGTKESLFVVDIPNPFADKPHEFHFTWAQPLAVAAIAVVTFFNYLGVRLGGQIQVALTAIKMGAVAFVIVLGFALSDPAPTAFQPMLPATRDFSMLTGFLAAMAGALWAYDGWNNVNLVGSEVKNPQRNIPLSLIGGVTLVALIYLLVNAVFFYAIPFEQIQALAEQKGDSKPVALIAVEQFAGSGVTRWFALALVLSAIGTLNSSILSGARVPYAMASEGIFFRVAESVHPRFRTPGGALILQGTLASVLALTGTFEELTNLFIFASWIFYGLTTASVFWLRRKEPDLPRPYRTWGYPWVPALFVIGALALTANLLYVRPGRSSIGLGLILLGLVFYNHWKKKRAAEEANRA